MQCAWAILSSVASPTLQYFSAYLKNGKIFGKRKFSEHKMCILIFSTTLFETFLILRRTERDMIKMYVGRHVKYPLFSPDFNETRNFLTDFSKTSRT